MAKAMMNKLVIENKGDLSDYLCCIAAGMIQFVCVRTGRESYHSLTADHICIHPGSVMFRQNPVFIVAREIVRTSRVFAMSVSPLTRPMLDKINPGLYERLMACKSSKVTEKENLSVPELFYHFYAKVTKMIYLQKSVYYYKKNN